MEFFKKFNKNSNLEKNNPSKNEGNTFMIEKAICLACEKKISNLESVVAGMGPICRERTGFAAMLPSKYLSSMEGNPQPIEKLKKTKTGIIRTTNQEDPLFGTLIFEDIGQDEMFFLDKSKISQKIKEGKSLTESYLESFAKEDRNNIISLSSLALPKNPEIRKQFKKYQKVYRQNLKEQLKSEPAVPIYQKVENKKSLTDEQLSARDRLIMAKKEDPKKYSLYMKTATYHLSTLLSRLKDSNLTEAEGLHQAISRQHKKTLEQLEDTDYGLTDKEIYTGLIHANKRWESLLFRSFSEGNSNLDKLILLYKSYPDLNEEDKILAKKIRKKLFNDEDLSDSDIEKFF